MGRKIAMVVNHVKMEDEDRLDVLYWRSKSAYDRLYEVARLRKGYYTGLNGSFPEKIVKVVSLRRSDV